MHHQDDEGEGNEEIDRWAEHGAEFYHPSDDDDSDDDAGGNGGGGIDHSEEVQIGLRKAGAAAAAVQGGMVLAGEAPPLRYTSDLGWVELPGLPSREYPAVAPMVLSAADDDDDEESHAEETEEEEEEKRGGGGGGGGGGEGEETERA